MRKRLFVISMLLLGLCVNAQLCFTPPSGSPFAVSGAPISITSADFNSDGKADLATPSLNNNNVSVRLGNGVGSFSPAVNFTVGSQPYFVISADFNADGKVDLATANYNSNNISVLLGSGTGSFTPVVNFLVGLNPRSLTCTDFNADGKADLAVVNSGNNNVSVLHGNGAGNFTTVGTFSVGSSPVSITNGDFNADGKADLAIANALSNNVSILLGIGTGSFATAVNFAVGTLPYSIKSGDFNGDGKIDLVVANRNSNNVSVLLGNGMGSFATAINFAVGSLPASIVSADFNADGKADLATANEGSNTESVLLGNGTGGFASALTFTSGPDPIDITSADFNADGKADLAMANLNGSNISILLNGIPVTANATASVVCAGASITLTGGGATTYTWSGGVNNGVAFIPPTGTTTYTVTGTNTIGCTNSAPKVITVNALPNISVSSGSICTGTSFTMVPSGANTYTYSNGSAIVSPTATTSYTVTGTNAQGCINSNTVNVLVSQIITVNSSTSSIVCIGGNLNLISNPSGGTSPYNFQWSGPNSFTSLAQNPVINNASNVNIGTYSLAITDDKGCKNSSSFYVPIPNLITVNIGSNSPACLYGDINLTSNPSGGTGSYTYNWNDNYMYTSTLQNPSLIGVASYPSGGFIYTVTVTDSYGCKKSQSTPVTFFSWNVNLNKTNPTLCSNPCNGSISSSVISGGHSPYKYSWSNSVTGPSQISGVCAGDYTLTISNTDGSCPRSFTTAIEPPVSINNEVGMINIACVSQTNVPAAFASYYMYDLPATISAPPSNPENFVDPGKKVRFKVLCKNQKSNGQSIVTGMCKVRCNSPYATLTDSIAALNNVAWNTQAWSADEFEMQLGNNLPEGTVIYVDFIVSENTLQYKTGCVPIPVTPLVYSVNNPNAVDDDNNPDSQGNGDGIVNPAETVEFYPWLNNVSPFSADYTYGQFKNLDNLSYVSIWNNTPGVNTTVYDHSWWNYGFGQPQQIPLGAQDMMPEFDFVFDYTNGSTVNNFKLYMVMAGGFNLFSSGVLSLVQWTLPYTFNNTAVSVSELENNSFVKIYPNPSSSYIVIELNTEIEETKLSLTDIMGKQVEQKVIKSPSTRFEFNTADLANGIYFLNIQNGQNSVTKKINIIK